MYVTRIDDNVEREKVRDNWLPLQFLTFVMKQ